ncbi:deoxyribodipyrimidine photo-lyase [Cupriavidus sp. AU9028]|uniref:cryptochrome/photolyase family protein n=1 Tax=Cupriavidus sp. AU9028 TaxID=2871157 RepID=UPI001C93FD37|nr:deoxyribodipyrimidine photo-lyase [Cupriavidus sp. AU9028]MBY4898099.1 DNA photolyase family protein [Cupriavidus sp. AU9028]
MPSSPSFRKPYRIGRRFSRALVWFRRDLRLDDHAALHYALRHGEQVWCVFVFDRDILDPLLARGLRADRRVEFILRSLASLDAALRAAGGGLIVLQGRAVEAVPALARELDVEAVFANHDYEPAAVARDDAVAQALAGDARLWLSFKDQVIFERDEILNGQGKPFAVFSPYKAAWLRTLEPFDLRPYPVQPYLGALAAIPPERQRPLPTLDALGFAATDLPTLPLPTGSDGGQALLDDFLERLPDYARLRDFPAARGPSYLSVHLRFGTVSVRTLARAAHAAMLAGGTGAQGAATWLGELIWRDFFFMVLHHHPRAAQGHAWQPAFDGLRFLQGEPARAYFDAWCEGRTGYPLVDAAMIQLRTSGYMHNRLRMVSASFLVKDLGVDWRWGEQWFADRLNDYDLAANNGNWQWAASTGCDAQPWFRIFNPVTQSKRFDAEGGFIRRYLPALQGLPDKYIHAPWTAPAAVLAKAGIALGRDYPVPLVQHDVARQETLSRYAAVRDSRNALRALQARDGQDEQDGPDDEPAD